MASSGDLEPGPSPRRLTSWKPCFSRILQASRPERTRSLPMRCFEACDEHFGMKPMF